MKSRLLFNEEPITINRLAANVLGLNEAIVVQQIHYWLNINEKAKKNFHDNKYWTYNTYNNWQKENFTFWSTKTVQRIFKSLFEKGILYRGKFNKKKYDQTLWVSINYERLEDILVAYENNEKVKEVKNIDIELDTVPDNMEVTNFIENLHKKIVTDNPQLSKNVEISTEGQNDQVSDCNIRTDCPSYLGQIDHINEDRLTIPIPETSTKTSTKTSICTTHQDAVVETPDTNKELIESNTHLLLDSNNKIFKVGKWKKDRLVKAIEIFKSQEGVYFSLLEKIYKDDRNFVDHNSSENKVRDKKLLTRFHNITDRTKNYTPDELEKHLQEMQKNKFKEDYNNKNDEQKKSDILEKLRKENSYSEEKFKPDPNWFNR